MVLEFAIIEFISSIFKSCFWFLNLVFGIHVTVVCYFDCRFFLELSFVLCVFLLLRTIHLFKYDPFSRKKNNNKQINW